MRLSTNELKTKYRFNIIKEEVQTSIGTLYLSKVKDYQRFFSDSLHFRQANQGSLRV